jgi:hypothetical protein
MSDMKNIESILGFIALSLRDILTRKKEYMVSWDIAELENLGQELINLSTKVQVQLTQVEHKVLFLSLREAGIGLKKRAKNLLKFNMKKIDKEYFLAVYEALDNICLNIENGEYYRALKALENNRIGERLDTEPFSS